LTTFFHHLKLQKDPDPGSEISDFQFEDPDPDPKLLTSDPEHWSPGGSGFARGDPDHFIFTRTTKITLTEAKLGYLLPEPVFRIRIGLNTDPDPAFEVKKDPDPTFEVNTDPDPDLGSLMTNIQQNFSFYSQFSSQIAV